MFLLVVLAMLFSPFVRFFGGIGSAIIMRTDEARISYTHNRAYQAASEKQTGFSAGPISRPRDIRVYKIGFSRPIACWGNPGTGHTPQKLPHNLSNLLLLRIIRPCSRTRAI